MMRDLFALAVTAVWTVAWTDPQFLQMLASFLGG